MPSKPKTPVVVLDIESLRQSVQTLREQVRLLSHVRPWVEALADTSSNQTLLSEMKRKFDINPRLSREGNVDFVVGRILTNHGVWTIEKIPELLSEIGVLVTSREVEAVAQVMDDYAALSVTDYKSPWATDGFRQPKPHLELLKSLPCSYFEQYSYYAPVEELFDGLSIFVYAGKRVGDAEDGAIGWLVDWLLKKLNWSIELLMKRLSNQLKHWETVRLVHCHQTWLDKVSPLLSSDRFSHRQYQILRDL